jgi:hypothetical protein
MQICLAEIREPIGRFLQIFDNIEIKPGIIVSLADEEIPLSRSVQALPLESFLDNFRNIV